MSNPAARTPSDGALLVAFFAGPLAFVLNHVVSYALVPHALHSHRKLALHLVTLGTLAVAVAGTGYGLLAYARCARAATDDEPARAQRRGFLALGGVGLGAMCALIIVGTAIGKYVIALTD